MTIRIYAACLASYNAGILHGAWIDASDDSDAMREEIADMLRKSPCPNVLVDCPDCEGADSTDCQECKGKGQVPSAEEWAIHDSEGLPSTFGEYVGIDAIAEYAGFIAQIEDMAHGVEPEDLAQAMVSHYGSIKYAAEKINDFCGLYERFKDYSDESADEQIACYSHGSKVPEFLVNYFDYDSWEYDLKHRMDYFDVGHMVAIFHQ